MRHGQGRCNSPTVSILVSGCMTLTKTSASSSCISIANWRECWIAMPKAKLSSDSSNSILQRVPKCFFRKVLTSLFRILSYNIFYSKSFQKCRSHSRYFHYFFATCGLPFQVGLLIQPPPTVGNCASRRLNM